GQGKPPLLPRLYAVVIYYLHADSLWVSLSEARFERPAPSAPSERILQTKSLFRRGEAWFLVWRNRWNSGRSKSSSRTSAIPEKTTPPSIACAAASGSLASRSQCSLAVTAKLWTAICG